MCLRFTKGENCGSVSHHPPSAHPLLLEFLFLPGLWEWADQTLAVGRTLCFIYKSGCLWDVKTTTGLRAHSGNSVHDSTQHLTLPQTQSPPEQERYGCRTASNNQLTKPFHNFEGSYSPIGWIRKLTLKKVSTWSKRSTKSLQIINAEEGVEKKEPSYAVGGNVNWCSRYGEKCGGSSKIKNRAVWSSNATPGHVPGENCSSERYMHPNVHSHVLQQPKHGSNLNVHWKKRIKKMKYIYTMEYLMLLLSHSVISNSLQPHGW